MYAVVGGGLAGLAAAYRLQRAGEPVTLFEANDRLGGLAASLETAGDPIERFYHHLSRSERTIVDYIEHLDLSDRLEWRVGHNAYYVDGVVHPLDTLWQIAAYPHLSLYDKFRLGMLTLGIDVRSGIPRRDAYEELEAYDDVPVRRFILEHTTERVYRSFFEPLLRAKFGDRKDDVSAAWLLGRVQFRGERDLFNGEILGYLDGGFHQLTEGLANALGREHIRTGAPVVDIDLGSGADPSVRTITVDGAGGPATHDVDGVIFATMPHVLDDLTGHECQIEFQGTVCSVVATDEPVTGTYWLNIADEAPFGALIEHTNFVPPDRYDGDHLLYVARYVQDLEGPFWQQETASIEAQWLDGIADMFPSFDADAVRWMETSRAARTAPIYDRGYLDRVVPYDLSDVIGEGVYYAGMATRAQYPERSLNGALRAGEIAAGHLMGVERSDDISLA